MKTLKEQTLEQFNKGMSYSELISEGADRGLTYYELRQFLTLLLKTVNDTNTKNVLNDLLKASGKLEIMKVPVPSIKKQKSVSPEIFG